jgi:hypothetical protein
MAPPKQPERVADKPAASRAAADAHEHKVLTNLFIQALKDRERSPQEAPDRQTLAQAAYQKLHYDWPVSVALGGRRRGAQQREAHLVFQHRCFNLSRRNG